MANYLEGRVIVVTGAGSGFGRLVSTKCGSLGAHLVCVDINADTAAETAELVKSANGDAISRQVDVTDIADLQAAAVAAVDQFGTIDVMVNNAGVMPLAFYSDHPDALEAWYRCIDINIKGVLNGTVAVYDQMIAQGRGHVVNLSSIYGNFPVAGAGVYGATKAAVNFLSESLRIESQGAIKVTTVRPTGVPATNLSTGVVNPEAIVGIVGQNVMTVGQKFEAMAAGQLPSEELDANEPRYFALDPDHLAEQIVYAINQPWGVSIAEVTVRATGEGYVL